MFANGFSPARHTAVLDVVDLKALRPDVVDVSDASLARLSFKLRYKVRYHLGAECPDADFIVEKSLARFLCSEQSRMLRSSDEIGVFLNQICRKVISEYCS